MIEKEAYLEIAKRFIETAKTQIANSNDTQELIAFESYHAFESIGGAFNSHYGIQVPNGHAAKLRAFTVNSNRLNRRTQQTIASLSIQLNSLRNKLLYPEPNGSSFKNPKDQISLTDAKALLSRINGIINKLEKHIA